MSKPKSTEGSCLPRLKMGCCCALPTCCKVQGWLSLIGSVGMIIRYLLHIILVLNAVPNLYGECSVYGRKLDDDDCSILRIMVGVSFVAIGYSAVLFVCSIFFLKGIGQKKPEYMVHFIRFMWTNMVLCVILVGFLLLFFPSNGGTVLIIIVTVVASLGFSLYCLLCANSLYHDFLEERERSEQLGAVVSLSPSPPPYCSKN